MEKTGDGTDKVTRKWQGVGNVAKGGWGKEMEGRRSKNIGKSKSLSRAP